jgi:transposase
MDARDVKALELTGNSRISFVGGAWVVPSQSGNGRHAVDPSPTAPSCTCEDFQLRGPVRPCKHILAVRLLLERQLKGEPNPTVIPQRPARPTYAQDWPNYNASQVSEKEHFQYLLADLCRAIPDLPPKRGRPIIQPADALFSAVFKVYSTFSGRRFMTDLRAAQDAGHVRRLVSYNSIFACLESEATTPILHGLIRRSSLPLRSVEVDFAIDSSGFSGCRYSQWVDEKYGVPQLKCDWVKAHLCCGVTTHVVTACRVEEKDSADCPQFAPLAKETAESFTIREMSGDKAYLSNDNLNLIDSLGGTAYVPFKVNTTGEGTPVWEKMYHLFSLHRQEFLDHYHKRSNSESVFSMIKRKLGDSVRSKTDRAMKNEALAKVVAHNVCCVIMAWYELGIDPSDFGVPTPAGEPPAVLRFPG